MAGPESGTTLMSKRALKNDFFELEYLTHSLRISGITPKGKNNLLVDLSHQPPVPTPYGDFYFRGGHRLWHAPEAMPRTYIPDENELKITEMPNGVVLETETEPGANIRKRIEIKLATDSPSLTLTHTLFNDGLWSLELAPWAITQFRLGGIVVLPMPTEKVDDAALLPNRQISFWTYARLNDKRLNLRDEFSLFHAESALPPFKMGYFNSHGWLAYFIDGVLFKKTFSAMTNATYPDNNCNAELYCNHEFVELESLGPLTRLEPGASVQHQETWELLEVNTLPQEVQQMLLKK